MVHILILDDDVRICSLLKRILQQNHYEITVCHCPLDAENISHKTSYDLLLTDVMMPQMSGYDFVQKIRNGETFFDKHLPVIMISAGLETQQRVTGLKFGADDYIVKPFAPEELIARIEALLWRSNHRILATKPLKTVFNSHYFKLISPENQLFYQEQKIDLTDKEIACLQIFMQHPEEIITRYDLIKMLFPELLDNPYSRALDVMMARLRKKIESLCGFFPILTKRNEGYLWHEEK